jgi:branched-chain amino acid aminotransferase
MTVTSTKTLVNINGEIFPAAKAQISVFDRGFLFGDSVYEVLRTYQHIPFLVDEHLKRLWFSAQGLNMPIKISPEELKGQIQKTIQAMEATDLYLRIILTRGEGAVGLDPVLAEGPNNLIIICQPKTPNPSWWYEQGVPLTFVSTQEVGIRKDNANIKSGNYQANMLAHIKAREKGVYDAIMVNPQDEVTEGPTFNVWMCKDGVVFTPPLEVGILEGITRQKILQLLPGKLPLEEDIFSPQDLLVADECFITSSTREVVPVRSIDDHPIGTGTPGPLTKQVLQIYRDFINEYLKTNS